MDDRKKWVIELHKQDLSGICTIEVFLDYFKDWTFDYIYKNDELIGASFHKDGYVHVAIAPEHRRFWARKDQIKQLITNAMIDGKAYTTAFRNDEFRKDFAKRLGFTLVKDSDVQTYEIKLNDIFNTKDL